MEMYEATRENIKAAAISTITEIWSCIDWDRVDSRRAMNIWEEVTSKVKAAAMTTTTYERFVEKLCRKLDVRSLIYSEIRDITHQSKEFKQGIIKMLREETLSVMLEVKLNNQVRREEAKHKKEQQEKEKALNKKLNGAQVSFTDKGVKVDEN